MNKQDEEKVKELLDEVSRDKFSGKVLLPDEPWHIVEFTSTQIRGAISDVALEMATWKEQQMIEKTIKWLRDNVVALDMGKYPEYAPDFIEKLKQALMEE